MIQGKSIKEGGCCVSSEKVGVGWEPGFAVLTRQMLKELGDKFDLFAPILPRYNNPGYKATGKFVKEDGLVGASVPAPPPKAGTKGPKRKTIRQAGWPKTTPNAGPLA